MFDSLSQSWEDQVTNLNTERWKMKLAFGKGVNVDLLSNWQREIVISLEI